jgi:hypothetical protein
MKSKIIDRFNQTDTSFLNDFQEVMLERLNLNYDGLATKYRCNKLVRNILKRPASCLNISTKEGFLLSCNIEPEIYLLAQEACIKTNNSVMPMDELIHLLLTCFILTYRKDPKPTMPFKHVRKGVRFNNLRKFQNTFSKYYQNSVGSFKDN